MKNDSGLLYKPTFVLAVLATGFLIYNMLATLIFREEIFIERETLAGVEIFILVGFGLILLFDISSFLWVILRLRHSQDVAVVDRATLVLGALCLLLLIGEKAMMDEIGRESRLGLGVRGEWIALYVGLTIQLIYNLVILSQLFRVYRTNRHDRTQC
jgi:hypothetical protein